MVSRGPLVFMVTLGVTALLAAAYGRLAELSPPAHRVNYPSATAFRARPASSAVVASAPAPEAARLDVRRQLYESVDALVQAGELKKARQLLDQDAERYGEEVAPEWRDLGLGYRLLADCVEHPSPNLRARAASFVVTSHAASLGSRVWSTCSATADSSSQRPRRIAGR